jgi:hypothetical protein
VSLGIMWLRSFAPAALVSAILAAGCDPYRCLVQTRAQQFELDTASGPAAGRVSLLLSQSRGRDTGDFVMWHVRLSGPTAPATRVVLREGPPQAPGRVLYDFPLVNPVPNTGVVTQMLSPAPYAGQVPFAELWDLVQSQQISFEVQLSGGTELRIGPLPRTSAGDWQDACT